MANMTKKEFLDCSIISLQDLKDYATKYKVSMTKAHKAILDGRWKDYLTNQALKELNNEI